MKTPEIRFIDYTDSWTSHTLGEVFDKVTEKNVDYSVTETFTNSAQEGVISQRDFFNHGISNDKNINGYYLVRPDDFVYNPRMSVTAPVGPINRNKLGRSGVMSPLYTVFRAKRNDVDLGYLEYYYKSSKWHGFMFNNGDNGARGDRFSIRDEVLKLMPISMPSSFSEQKSIADFLEQLDNYISFEEKKLENLRNIKSAYLIKLFPKEGGTEPEIRFKGFGARWLNKPLGELVSYKKELNNLAHCDQLLSLSYGKIIKKDITASKGLRPQSYKTYQIINPGTIVLRLTDLQNDHKSIRVGLSQNHGIVSPAYVCFNMKESLCANYCYYVLLLYDSIYKQFYKMGDGLRQTLSFNELKDLIIPVPSEIKEQNVIAEFFISMDEYIKSSEDKISKLKRIRKGLLERMFVDSNKD